MKNLKFFLGSAAALCLMAGCADEWVVNDTNKPNEGAPFVIHANNGADADTRLAFGENGLSLQWEDGDQLVLVSVDDKVAPIYLTTTLDEPATKATFVADTEAPAGTYYVFNVPDYGENRPGETPNETPQKFEDWICPNMVSNEFNALDSYYQLKDLSELGKSARMYAGPIEIGDGQTSLDINLKHGFVMLKFNITGKNEAVMANDYKTIGMICPSKSIPIDARLDGMGSANKSSAKLEIGNHSLDNVMGAFILPVDLSNQDVYFYIYTFEYTETGHTETVYEIIKKGIHLKAGTCYTINLDLNAAKKIELVNGQVYTPDHFRLMAYKCHHYNYYTLTQDIDFKGEQIFPITAPEHGVSFDGQGHTLSNLTIDWPHDGVGLFDYWDGTISDLNLQNVTINGTKYVGAFCGKISNGELRNCTLSGINHVTGTGDYVGGLVGEATGELNSCSVSKETTVQGRNFVGGIVGESYEVTDCKSAATVNGVNNVGGVTGLTKGLLTGCSSSSVVTATGDYVGGLVGSGVSFDQPRGTINAIKCYTTGSVKGNNYVGGIIGSGIHDGRNNLFKECYSTASVSGNSYVGGIAGADCTVQNSYFIGTVTGKDATTTAGITGHISRYEDTPTQSNCYSAGTISSGYGILATDERYLGIYRHIMNCLTTAPHLGSADTELEQAYTNITSIQEHLDVINGELAYSTTNIWPDYSFACPKLRWQTTISTGTGDEGTDAPEFEEDEW